MSSIKKCEEVDTDAAVSDVMNNLDEMNQQKVENELNSDVDLIPKDTGWAWMCCLGCFLQNVVTIGGVVRCFGIFYVAFMEEFNSKAGNAAWIAVLCGLVLNIGGSFTTALAMRYSSRTVVFSGGVFLFIGYIASMFVTRIEHLFATYGLLLGLGCSLSWSVSISHMGQYFKERRAIANGIAISGVGIGQFVLPAVVSLLLQQYGLKGTLLVMAAISSHVCVAGALLRPLSAYRRNLKSKRIAIYDNRKENVTLNQETSHDSSLNVERVISSLNICKSFFRIYSLLEWSLLRKWSYVLYGISIALYFAAYPTYFHITPAYAEQVGLSKTQAAYLVSISGLGQLLSRFGVGFLADCHLIPTYILMAVLTIAGGIASYITPFMTGFIPLGCVGFVFSICLGPVMALHPVLLAETFGVRRLNSSIGIMCLFQGAGIPLSTSVGGILRDATGNWQASFWYAATMLCFSGMVMLLRPVAMKIDERFGKRNSSSC